jgi:hypothetical protein
VRRQAKPLTLIALALLSAGLAACNRGQPKLTECLGDVPAVPRIHDVAPPNCPSS